MRMVVLAVPLDVPVPDIDSIKGLALILLHHMTMDSTVLEFIGGSFSMVLSTNKGPAPTITSDLFEGGHHEVHRDVTLWVGKTVQLCFCSKFKFSFFWHLK